MMQVTYIFHSGFCVEAQDSYYIFDYYRGEIPELDKNTHTMAESAFFPPELTLWSNEAPG